MIKCCRDVSSGPNIHENHFYRACESHSILRKNRGKWETCDLKRFFGWDHLVDHSFLSLICRDISRYRIALIVEGSIIAEPSIEAVNLQIAGYSWDSRWSSQKPGHIIWRFIPKVRFLLCLNQTRNSVCLSIRYHEELTGWSWSESIQFPAGFIKIWIPQKVRGIGANLNSSQIPTWRNFLRKSDSVPHPISVISVK
jgi:hypothetical protein